MHSKAISRQCASKNESLGSIQENRLKRESGGVSRETPPLSLKLLTTARAQNIHDAVEVFDRCKLDTDLSLTSAQRNLDIRVEPVSQ